MTAAEVACLGVCVCSDPKGPHLCRVPLRKHQPVPGRQVPLCTWAACLPALTCWTPESRDAQGWGGLHRQGLGGTLPSHRQLPAEAGEARAEDCQAAPRCPRLAASSRPPSGRRPGDAGRPASVAAAAGRSGAVRRKRARRPEEVSAYTGVFFLIPIVSLSEVGSARSAFAQPLRSQQGRVALETGAEWPPRGTPGMGRRDLGSVFSRPGPRPVTAMLWPRGVDACAVLPRRWRWRWTPARQGKPLVWGSGRCPPHLQEVSRARIAGVASAERSDGVGVRGRCRGPGVSPGCEESPVLGERAVERATHRGPAWFPGGKAGLGLEGLGPNVRGRVEVGAAVGEAGRTSCPVRVGEPLPHPVRAWPGLSAGGRGQDAAAPATDPAHRASCRVLP